MNIADYTLRYFTCDGTYIGDFDIITEMQCGRAKNEIGMAEIVMPSVYDIEIFNKDYILEIWRYDRQKGSNILVGNTCWFLRRVQICMNSVGEETVTLTFYDTISLLNRKFVNWYEIKKGTGEDEYPGIYPSALFETFDVMLDRIFFHNFTQEGQITYLSEATDGDVIGENLHELVGLERGWFDIDMTNTAMVSRIPDQTKYVHTFAYENCLDAMGNVVDMAESLESMELWFDILYYPSTEPNVMGNFKFSVSWNFTGTDLTMNNSNNPLFFGPEFNNIYEPCLTLDWENEATEIIAVGGSADKTVVGLTSLKNGVTIPSSASYAKTPSSDTCPFYPIEGYITDDRKQDNHMYGEDALNSTTTKANSELRKRSAVHTLTGEIAQSEGSYLFTDYNYGDLVTINWKNLTFDATIKKFMITVDNRGEQITIPFEGVVRARVLE